jgi:plastin-1
LNLAFVANLFNTWPGLAPLEEAEAPPEIEDFDAEGEREARVFTLWLNSLDVEPGVYNFFENLKVGRVIWNSEIDRNFVADFNLGRLYPIARFR